MVLSRYHIVRYLDPWGVFGGSSESPEAAQVVHRGHRGRGLGRLGGRTGPHAAHSRAYLVSLP